MKIPRLVRGLFGVGLLAGAGAVQAITFSNIDDMHTVDFNGIVEGTVVPGLTSTVKYTLEDLSANAAGDTVAALKVEITNTTTLDRSRVSIVGFDIDPSATATASGIFDNVATNRNVPQLGTRDLCFSAKPGQANCAGGGNGGVTNIGPSNTGMFTALLTFAGNVSSFTLSDLFVRYQSILGTNLGTSGVGVPMSPVPLPAAAWLFLTGVIGLFGWSRRRAATTA